MVRSGEDQQNSPGQLNGLNACLLASLPFKLPVFLVFTFLNALSGGAGQGCTATSRLYVQDTIWDQSPDAFKKHTKENTNVGTQFDADTNHLPRIIKAAK